MSEIVNCVVCGRKIQVETNKIIKEIDNRINKLKEVVGVLKE